MADDERRVQPRPMVVAGGMTATPEGIAELERQRARFERAHRPTPGQSFASVLERSGPDRASRGEEDAAPRLPRKGPRPSFTHPNQRDTFGREDAGDEPVVLKG